MNQKKLALLHGALGDRRQFDSLALLLEPHYDLFIPNLPGHGDRALAFTGFRIEDFAADLDRQLAERGWSQPDLFGYSMGGYVALQLALTRPNRAGRIFTLATKYRWSPEDAARETRFLDPETMAAKVPAFARILDERHVALGWRRVLSETAALMMDLGNRNPLMPELANIAHRVRIGIGDRDAMAGLADSVLAYQALGNGEFEVFPNTAHPLEKCEPIRLAQSIRDFFC